MNDIDLGICVMIGKHTIIWHAAYIPMAFFMAEMVSIIPFSGGCYGYVRCTMGHFFGYIIGCIEAIKYIIFTAFGVYSFSNIFLEVFEFDDRWLLVIWFGFLSFAVGLKALPFSAVLVLWGMLACGTMTILAMVIFGALKYGKESNLAIRNNVFDKSEVDFIRGLAYSGYLFFGVDVMRTCVYNESNRIVPWAMVNMTMASSIIAVATVFAVRSYVIDARWLASSFYSYSVPLGIVFPEVDVKMITLFSLAGVTGNALAFFYSGVKQMSSMMGSGLIPIIPVGSRYGVPITPVVSEVDHAIYSEVDQLEDSEHSRGSQISLRRPERRRISNLEVHSLFVSAILVFAVLSGGYYFVDGYLGKVFHFGGQDRFWQGLALVFLIFGCSINYHLVVKRKQHFNEEEQEKFMKAYIMNANQHKRRRTSAAKSPVHRFVISVHSSLIGNNTSNSVSLRSPLPSPSNKARSVASASLPLVKKSSTSTKGDSVTNKVEEGVSSPSADNIAGADISMRNTTGPIRFEPGPTPQTSSFTFFTRFARQEAPGIGVEVEVENFSRRSKVPFRSKSRCVCVVFLAGAKPNGWANGTLRAPRLAVGGACATPELVQHKQSDNRQALSKQSIAHINRSNLLSSSFLLL
eukprot:scaffold1498_cov180-Ochromonas_danica.AAC.35